MIELLGQIEIFDLVLLIGAAFIGGGVAGIGGPGGILMIFALYTVFALTPAQTAGTASLIFLFSTLVGFIAYTFSRDIHWKVLGTLAPTTIAGTQTGAYLNAFVSEWLFITGIGILMLVLGFNFIYRETRGLGAIFEVDESSRVGMITIAGVGFLTGVISGITGLGGAAITIPLLIVMGIPTLLAIGTGVSQGVIVTISTSSSYLMRGSIVFDVATIAGPVFATGVVSGWFVAQRVDTTRLKLAIGGVLITSGLYMLI